MPNLVNAKKMDFAVPLVLNEWVDFPNTSKSVGVKLGRDDKTFVILHNLTGSAVTITINARKKDYKKPAAGDREFAMQDGEAVVLSLESQFYNSTDTNPQAKDRVIITADKVGVKAMAVELP